MSLTRVPFSDLVTFTRASEGYALDADGIWQKSLTNVPRFDWSTGKRAQLIEAAAQNVISEPVPNFTGTVWVDGLVHGGLTTDFVEMTAINGVSAAVFRAHGTMTGGTARVSVNTVVTRAPAANDQVWTASALVHVLADVGAASPVGMSLAIVEETAPNTYLTDGSSFSHTFAEIKVQARRIFHTRALTNAATDQVRIEFVVNGSTGRAIDITFVVTGLQLEKSPVPTSLILAEGKATRAADLTSKDLSGYDFSTGITVSFEGNLGAVVDTYDRCLTVSDGTHDNVILLFYNKPGASLELAVKAGGVTQVSQSLGAGLGTDVKAAVSVSAAGDIVVVLDGTTKASVSGKTLPALNLLRIGRDPAGFNIPAVLHHYETLIKEGPSTEAELKALTA